MEFQDELAGGVFLIRPALRSPDYVAGVSGWTINVDGSAEFNDVVIRGDLSSSNYVPGVSGWHLDDAGNAEFNDIVIRGSGSGDDIIIGASTEPQVRIGSTASIGYVAFPTNRPSEDLRAIILAGTLNEGAANEAQTLQIFGPTTDTFTDRAYMLLTSQGADGTSDANLNLRAGSASVILDEQNLVLQSSQQARFITTASADTAMTVEADGATTGSLFRVIRGGSNRLEVTNAGRLLASPASSALPAFHVNTAAGYTGHLLRADLNGVARLAVTAEGTTSIISDASALAALTIDTQLAHTGALLRMLNDSNDMFRVETDGFLSTYGGNDYPAWVPTITGGGAATLSTADGWTRRYGTDIYVYAYFVIGVAGSGATVVQLNLPFTPWRGAANRRQELPGAVRDGGYANPGPVAGIVFAGGAGATVNRLVDSAGTDVTGAALTAGSIWIFQGWLREA